MVGRRPPNAESDIHGDAWKARIGAQDEYAPVCDPRQLASEARRRLRMPKLALDSERPGLVDITVKEGAREATTWLTRREARDLAIAIAATPEQGFMRSRKGG